jgi:hypothetical protein
LYLPITTTTTNTTTTTTTTTINLFWRGKSVEGGHLEDPEEDGQIAEI